MFHFKVLGIYGDLERCLLKVSEVAREFLITNKEVFFKGLQEKERNCRNNMCLVGVWLFGTLL